MVRSGQSALPIRNLGEVAASLEAAIRLCLAKPLQRAVHDLRTATRRVEAQLELLSMLPDLPPHAQQRQLVLGLLKKLRRAAGQVRDLDVQLDLIRREADADKNASSPDPAIRVEARRLRRTLNRDRDHAADHLQQLLHKQHARLPQAFGELLATLAPAESTALSELRLIELILARYGSPRETETPELPVPDDTARLHELRKRAKLARYLAESAPKSAVAAQRLAGQFAILQRAGGEWHDWLILAEIAADELGDSAKLPQRFLAHAEVSLRAFRQRLGEAISPADSAHNM
jgi:CHAD domain-containing protein